MLYGCEKIKTKYIILNFIFIQTLIIQNILHHPLKKDDLTH